MCFSATASFTASGLLVALGALTLRKTPLKHQWLLASVPLLFAAQQFTEGLLWLSLKHEISIGPYWPMLIYVMFIGIVWPVLIPLGVLHNEPQPKRRLFIAIPLMLGIGIACYFIWALDHYGVTARIQNHCIVYDTNAYAGVYIVAAYAIATCAAFFFSDQKSMVRTGWINAIAFFVAFYLYRVYLTSAWCFFAAILSGLLYLHFTNLSYDSRRKTSPIKDGKP